MNKYIIIGLLVSIILINGCFKENEYYCEQDSDCVLAMRIDVCCDCPTPYAKEEVNVDKNLVAYEKGKDYSSLITVDCTGEKRVSCSPCKPITGIECYNNECKWCQTPLKPFKCPEEDIINCMPIVSNCANIYCIGEYYKWIEENCNTSFIY